jgi:hypothetical protein
LTWKFIDQRYARAEVVFATETGGFMKSFVSFAGLAVASTIMLAAFTQTADAATVHSVMPARTVAPAPPAPVSSAPAAPAIPGIPAGLGGAVNGAVGAVSGTVSGVAKAAELNTIGDAISKIPFLGQLFTEISKAVTASTNNLPVVGAIVKSAVGLFNHNGQ